MSLRSALEAHLQDHPSVQQRLARAIWINGRDLVALVRSLLSLSFATSSTSGTGISAPVSLAFSSKLAWLKFRFSLAYRVGQAGTKNRFAFNTNAPGIKHL